MVSVVSDVKTNQKSFQIFAVLMALCVAAHMSVHLPAASLSAIWLLGVAVLLCAVWLIYRPSVKILLVLALLQSLHVAVDAPYNPDHWLLVFFVNLAVLGAASSVWLKGQHCTPERLMEALVPVARLLFLVCYGYAAFAKYNFDFLFSETSVAREMLEYQVGAMPLLAWLVWPAAVAWVALVCETSVPLLLLSKRTRHFGILVGIFFHAALVISPAVKVYDFTIVVYTMLYLFTPAEFDRNLQQWFCRIKQQSPHLYGMLSRSRGFLLLVPTIGLIAISLQTPLLEVSPQIVWLRWMIAMSVVCCLGGLACIGIFSGSGRDSSVDWIPSWRLSYGLILLAIINGLCPYLGLKTQGSFTMFSNLQTEAGEWNHLLMPEGVRFSDQYQDRLVRVVASSDTVLNKKYVEPGLLATEFELRRRIMAQPSLSLTIERDGQEVVIDRADRDASLGKPLDLLSRKLLVFRPVSPDGQPFITN